MASTSLVQLLYQSLGAQVLQVQWGGTEVLYRSPLYPDPNAPARGGVPVLFPQFAKAGLLKKHGWARDVPWVLLKDQKGPGGHSVTLRLAVGIDNPFNWPHAAELTLSAKAVHDAQQKPRNLPLQASLEMSLTVRNIGSKAFSWTGGLHPYWFTPDLLRSELLGFAQPVRWQGEEFETLFDNLGPLTLKTPFHTLQLSMTGFDQWMVWNPGREGAKALADLPDADWQQFVCIEPVIVDRPNTVEPGAVFEGTLMMELVETGPAVTDDFMNELGVQRAVFREHLDSP
jgi:glucose-6-phosphate 1-epimerase